MGGNQIIAGLQYSAKYFQLHSAGKGKSLNDCGQMVKM